MDKTPKFEIVLADRLITPNQGSLVFPISKQVSYREITLGWAAVELRWQEATLIGPFLDDVKNLVLSQPLEGSGEDSLDRVVKLVKTRFSDWGVSLAFILITAPGRFQVLTYGNYRVYVLNRHHFVEVPGDGYKVACSYVFGPNHPLVVVNQQIPAGIEVADLDLFIDTLRQSGQSFVIIKSASKESFGARLRTIPPKKVLTLTIIGLLALGGLTSSWLISRHRAIKPTSPPAPAAVQLKDSLDEIMVIMETDPTEALRQLERIKQKVNFYQITDPVLRSSIDQIEQQLSDSLSEGIKLTYQGRPLSRIKLKTGPDQVLAVSDHSLYSLNLDNQTVKLEKIFDAPEEIKDFTVIGRQIIFLTTKGIFKLESDNRLTQLADVPVDEAPELIGAYLDNLYLLTRSGSVYKYPNGLVEYPQRPQRYFTDPSLQQAKRMIIKRRFYFLTRPGRLVKFYFGREQAFKLDKNIDPINDIYYQTEADLFWFVGPAGWGSFSPSGQVLEYITEENNYDQIVVWQDKIILLKDNRLFLQDRQ